MGKEIFEVLGVKVYETDLSKDALERIKVGILNNWETETIEERVSAVKLQLVTGEDLTAMLLLELETNCDPDVIKVIISNEKFEMNEEIWQNLSKASSWEVRVIAAESSIPKSNKLAEMLLLELETKCDPDVIKAIISNEKFEMNENIWKETLMSAEKCGARKSELYEALRESEFATTENLKTMILKDLQTACSPDYVIKILSIGNIKMDQELWSSLGKSNFQCLRETAAQSDFPTKRELQNMLIMETENACNKHVITAIISNPKFC